MEASACDYGIGPDKKTLLSNQNSKLVPEYIKKWTSGTDQYKKDKGPITEKTKEGLRICNNIGHISQQGEDALPSIILGKAAPGQVKPKRYVGKTC